MCAARVCTTATRSARTCVSRSGSNRTCDRATVDQVVGDDADRQRDRRARDCYTHSGRRREPVHTVGAGWHERPDPRSRPRATSGGARRVGPEVPGHRRGRARVLSRTGDPPSVASLDLEDPGACCRSTRRTRSTSTGDGGTSRGSTGRSKNDQAVSTGRSPSVVMHDRHPSRWPDPLRGPWRRSGAAGCPRPAAPPCARSAPGRPGRRAADRRFGTSRPRGTAPRPRRGRGLRRGSASQGKGLGPTTTATSCSTVIVLQTASKTGRARASRRARRRRRTHPTQGAGDVSASARPPAANTASAACVSSCVASPTSRSATTSLPSADAVSNESPATISGASRAAASIVARTTSARCSSASGMTTSTR